jgi:hypothetical protein
MLRHREPTELGKLRTKLLWRELPRWADQLMCAGLAAFLAAFVMEYVVARTFEFHLRDIGPMVTLACVGFWLTQPVKYAGFVGERGIAAVASSPLTSSRRVLLFDTAACVEVARSRDHLTFIWYDAHGAPVFLHRAVETDEMQLAFGHAAVEAFRASRPSESAGGAVRLARPARARASARRRHLEHCSHSIRQRRHSAVPCRRCRGRA